MAYQMDNLNACPKDALLQQGQVVSDIIDPDDDLQQMIWSRVRLAAVGQTPA